MRRSRPRVTAPAAWTLGDFLAAATRQIDAALPIPGRRQRRTPPNFTPRRGRSATSTARKTAVPPIAERRAQIHILRTLGIVGIDQRITAAEMQAYEGLFTATIPLSVLSAIAALVDRELPADPTIAPITMMVAGSPIEA